MGELEGRRRRRALVTGAAVRVGRSVALALAREGYDLALHFHRSRDAARDTARRAREAGAAVTLHAADLAEADAARRLVREAAEGLEGLDLLVNNAAIFPREPPEAVSPESWDRAFAVNARAPFFCSVEARGPMEAGGRRPSIVNIADVAAFEAWPSYAPYAATKAALVSLTRSLARAWAPAIRVNAVAPGPVLLPEGSGPEEREEAARSTALGRVGEPGEVARAVIYLDRAAYVTGQTLRVDGGEGLLRSRGPDPPG